MKRFLKSVLILVLMVGLSSGLYSNGLNLNGNGSKAIAMGGAFVGLADDFSAVFWNPAGLTQIEKPNLAIFATDILPTPTYRFPLLGIDTEANRENHFSGALGFFKPLSDKVVAGIYAYIPSGLSVEWPGADLALLSNGMAYQWSAKVVIITVSPAIAFKVSDKFSLGATININYGIGKIKRPGLGQYDEDINGVAVGATLGMLFKPVEKFSFGLTFRSPFKATLKGDATMSGAPVLGLPGMDDAQRDVTWPMWVGAGIAFKPNNKLTFTVDAQYTDWKQMDVIPMTFSNAGWQLFFKDLADLTLRWDSKVQVRFGAEYKVSPSFALRGGYYYDPSPSPKSTMNILLPELSYNFFTIGFGYSTSKINLDVCLEYAAGKEVEVGILEAEPEVGMPGFHNMNILVPNISLTIKF